MPPRALPAPAASAAAAAHLACAAAEAPLLLDADRQFFGPGGRRAVCAVVMPRPALPMAESTKVKGGRVAHPLLATDCAASARSETATRLLLCLRRHAGGGSHPACCFPPGPPPAAAQRSCAALHRRGRQPRRKSQASAVRRTWWHGEGGSAALLLSAAQWWGGRAVLQLRPTASCVPPHHSPPRAPPVAPPCSLRAIDPERYAIVDEALGGALLEEIEESKVGKQRAWVVWSVQGGSRRDVEQAFGLFDRATAE